MRLRQRYCGRTKSRKEPAVAGDDRSISLYARLVGLQLRLEALDLGVQLIEGISLQIHLLDYASGACHQRPIRI